MANTTISVPPPPRLTGDYQSDSVALSDWVWALYNALAPQLNDAQQINQQGLVALNNALGEINNALEAINTALGNINTALGTAAVAGFPITGIPLVGIPIAGIPLSTIPLNLGD